MRLLLCLLAACLLTAGEGATAAAAAPTTTGAVAYLPIDGPIDSGKARYFKRALADARAKGVRSVVVHLTTDGGELGAGREMLLEALNAPVNGPRLIAFVDNRAYSAGSLIAFGHHEILLTPQATIGDIGVIMIKDGSIEYAPEKIETVVRTLLRLAGQNRGWNTAKLAKMVARNQALWEVDLGPGREWIIGDDLPAWLSRHQDIERKDDHLLRAGQRVGHVLLGGDRLLSYSAADAVADGMATALVPDLDAVYARLGTSRAAALDLRPTTTETVSWTLAGIAPLLAALAVLLVILEFKMPSGGLWLALAAVAGLAFFVCQFYMELAGAIELVLILLGLALLVVEVAVLPTGGWLAGLGGLLAIAGFVLAFMPNASQFDPAVPEWSGYLTNAVLRSLLAITGVTVGAILAILALPRLALRTGLAAAAAIDATSARAGEAALAGLSGRRGTALSDLSPGGRVAVDGRELGATSENGEFIAAGAAIEVAGTRFGEVVVRPAAGT